MAIHTIIGELFFHNILGSNSCMVSTGHPQDIIATQSPVAAENILQCIIKCVTHVKDAGDIWRRDYNGIALLIAFLLPGRKQQFLFPEIVPAFFHVMWFITFVKKIGTHIILLHYSLRGVGSTLRAGSGAGGQLGLSP